MSRTSLKAQLVTNDLINQLGQASASWESTHDLTQIPLSEIFPNVKQLFKLSKLITKQTNACFVTWAVLAALLAFVSHRFFLRTESLRGALPPPPPPPPVTTLPSDCGGNWRDGVYEQFYIFTAQYLLRLVRKVLKNRLIEDMSYRKQSSIDLWTELAQEFCEFTGPDASITYPDILTVKPRLACMGVYWFVLLSDFLYWYSIIITVTVGCELVACTFQIFSRHFLFSWVRVSHRWYTFCCLADLKSTISFKCRLASTLICQIPGIAMSPALLFQSVSLEIIWICNRTRDHWFFFVASNSWYQWRIFTERQAAEETAFRELASENRDTSSKCPELAADLLVWLRTDFLLDASPIQLENFPGLRKIGETSEECNDSGTVKDFSENHIAINITQSVNTSQFWCIFFSLWWLCTITGYTN